MESKVKQVTFNLDLNVDADCYKYVESMPDFSGLTKELIFDYFSKVEFPNETLMLKKNNRKLASRNYSDPQRLYIEKEIERLEKLIGIPYIKRTATVKRLKDLNDRLKNKDLSSSQVWRINKEIKEIESNEND